jgi:chromosome segregation ATPase
MAGAGYYEMRDLAATLERELAAMTAAKEHIGSSLAVVTAERDTLRREHNGCALWAEAARRERDRLKAELANATAAKELAERQVAVLCARIDNVTFGSTICSSCPSRDRCSLTGCKEEMAAWSRAEAEGGGL